MCRIKKTFNLGSQKGFIFQYLILRERCPYLEFFWSVFSHIWTEYGDILRISPYSIRIRENKDHQNFEYEHILPSVTDPSLDLLCKLSKYFGSFV